MNKIFSIFITTLLGAWPAHTADKIMNDDWPLCNLIPSKSLNPQHKKTYEEAKQKEYRPLKASNDPIDIVTRKKFSITDASLAIIHDQKKLGACSAFTVNDIIYYRMHKQENWNTSEKFIPSTLYQYYNSRKLWGNQGEDSGSTIAEALLASYLNGYANEEEWPYDDSKASKNSKYKQEPPQKLYENAKKKGYSIRYHEILMENTTEFPIQKIKTNLLKSKPVIIGMNVYESFKRTEKTIPIPKDDEKHLGAHAMLIIGYNDEKKLFKIKNSWGERWGNKGYAYISYEYAMTKDKEGRSNVIELWTIDGILKEIFMGKVQRKRTGSDIKEKYRVNKNLTRSYSSSESPRQHNSTAFESPDTQRVINTRLVRSYSSSESPRYIDDQDIDKKFTANTLLKRKKTFHQMPVTSSVTSTKKSYGDKKLKRTFSSGGQPDPDSPPLETKKKASSKKDLTEAAVGTIDHGDKKLKRTFSTGEKPLPGSPPIEKRKKSNDKLNSKEKLDKKVVLDRLARNSLPNAIIPQKLRKKNLVRETTEQIESGGINSAEKNLRQSPKKGDEIQAFKLNKNDDSKQKSKITPTKITPAEPKKTTKRSKDKDKNNRSKSIDDE